MCSVQCLLLLIWAVSPSYSFNLETREALVFSSPTPSNPQDRQSYFGFAVTLHAQHDGDPWLVVGAPRSNSSLSQPEDIVEPGAVFKCSIHKNHQCQEINLMQENDNIYKSGSWLGGSLDTQPKYRDDRQATVVCAPLRTTFTNYLSVTLMNGACIWLNSSLARNPFSQMTPLSYENYQFLNTGKKNIHFYAHGQVGFSVHFPDDNTKMLLGAPGVFDWQGSVVKMKDMGLDGGEGATKRRRRQAPRDNMHMFRTYYVPNPNSTAQIQDYNMAGYSVTSGRYLEADKVLYATGAPKGAHSFGKVIIFDFPSSEFGPEPLVVLQEWSGPQFGSYFGTALASPDINGDGLNDLVMGAPLFSGRDWELPDMGMVQIALSSKGQKLQKSNAVYHGSRVSFAKFGSTLAAIGDLNADGYEDFAVGAPFEGDGAVYIYHGSGGAMPSRHSQRLTPDDFSASLSGFGIALSRGVDVDKNEYPDLAIGSFLSGHAIVIKSRPVAVFNAAITSTPKAITVGDTAFTISVCVQYHGKNVPKVTAITGTVDLDSNKSRVQFSDTKTTSRNFTTELQVKEVTCLNYSIHVQDVTTSVHEPILLELDYQLTENAQQPLIGQAIRDPDAYNVVTSNVRILTGCETDTCQTNLSVAANFVGYGHGQKMVIGENQTPILAILVSNSGEPSFESNMTVRVDYPLSLLLPETHSCTYADTGLLARRTELICQLLNPIRKDEEDTVEVEIDTRKLTDAWSELRAEVVVGGDGEEVWPRDNALIAGVGLQTSATLTFEGYSHGEQVLYSLDDTGKLNTSESVSVLHHFNLVKEGPTPLEEVSLQISVPHAFIGGHTFVQVYQPQIVVSDEEIVVESRNVTSEAQHLGVHARSNSAAERKVARDADINCFSREILCSQFVYVVGPWPTGTSSIHLSIRLDLNLTILVDHLPSLAGVLKSTATATVTSSSYSVQHNDEISTGAYSVGTKILEHRLARKGVPWWVILLAVLGGLALLGLAAYGLYTTGFFQRLTPDSLQAQVLPSTS